MSTSTSLQDLHDIVAPAAVSWLPPAPGWYALGVTVLLFLLWGAVVWYQRWLRNAYRREALIELAQIESDLAGSKDIHLLLPSLPELLKRTALAAYGRETVASLCGEPWLTFLDQTIGKPVFSGKRGRLLLSSSYDSTTLLQSVSQKEIRDLCRAVHTWLNSHQEIVGHLPQATHFSNTKDHG